MSTTIQVKAAPSADQEASDYVRVLVACVRHLIVEGDLGRSFDSQTLATKSGLEQSKVEAVTVQIVAQGYMTREDDDSLVLTGTGFDAAVFHMKAYGPLQKKKKVRWRVLRRVWPRWPVVKAAVTRGVVPFGLALLLTAGAYFLGLAELATLGATLGTSYVVANSIFASYFREEKRLADAGSHATSHEVLTQILDQVLSLKPSAAEQGSKPRRRIELPVGTSRSLGDEQLSEPDRPVASSNLEVPSEKRKSCKDADEN